MEETPLPKRTRKKPDLSGVEPKPITIRTAKGEKTFSARARPKKEAAPQAAESAPPQAESAPPVPQNPWSSVMNSWLD